MALGSVVNPPAPGARQGWEVHGVSLPRLAPARIPDAKSMPTPLLIGSCEPFSGKSAVVLGLGRLLSRQGVSIVFGKPLAADAAARYA